MEKKTIRDTYVSYWLENGHRPVSVHTFCKQLDLPESQFYDFYASFDALERDIWLAIFEETLQKLKEDETYRSYSVREKLLAFYFLWVQHLREYRSYILLQKEKHFAPGLHLDKLESLRLAFFDYVRDLIREAHTTGEIKERKFISDTYVHGFWVQALFVLRYWINDNSDRFELTDAAIEKAVNLSFQLISSNTLDSILDFGKFIFTRK